jgi:hypothetical protein
MAGPLDSELLELPILVVAHWDGAPVESYHRIEKDVCTGSELRTEIVVQRSIVGEVKPGRHKILVTGSVGWTKEEPLVCSYASCEQQGDASADASNLWFLYPGQSLDPENQTDYLELGFFRAVQPLALEPYFAALRANELEQRLPQLLETRNDVIIVRTLKTLCGGLLPWPYEDRLQPYEYGNVISDERLKAIQRVTEIVRPVIEQWQEPEARRAATAVYALGAGKDSVPLMRRLLENKDPELRAIAIGTLAANDDVASAESMAAAIRDDRRAILAQKVIQRLAAWKRTDVSAPILMNFLQSDAGAEIHYRLDTIPAVLAQRALRALTALDAADPESGVLFPFHVERSLAAWRDAATIADARGRRDRLRELLPDQRDPIDFIAKRVGPEYVLVVTNRSSRPLTLLRSPTSFLLHGRTMLGSWERRADNAEFVTMAPGESLEVPCPEDPSTATIQLGYGLLPADRHQEGWLGIVVADIPFEE